MERRLRAIEQSVSPAPFAKELAGFGWWFTADKFGDAWSLGMPLKVLQLTMEIEGGMNGFHPSSLRRLTYEIIAVGPFAGRGPTRVQNPTDFGWFRGGQESKGNRIIGTYSLTFKLITRRSSVQI